MIVQVNVVLNRTLLLLTVADISTTCAVVIFRVKVSCITSVDGIELWLVRWHSLKFLVNCALLDTSMKSGTLIEGSQWG